MIVGILEVACFMRYTSFCCVNLGVGVAVFGRNKCVYNNSSQVKELVVRNRIRANSKVFLLAALYKKY